MNFLTIKKNYNNGKGCWTKAMVREAVKRGVITKEQYKEITSEEYDK